MSISIISFHFTSQPINTFSSDRTCAWLTGGNDCDWGAGGVRHQAVVEWFLE